MGRWSRSTWMGGTARPITTQPCQAFWEQAALPLGLDARFIDRAIARAHGNIDHAVTSWKQQEHLLTTRRRTTGVPLESTQQRPADPPDSTPFPPGIEASGTSAPPERRARKPLALRARRNRSWIAATAVAMAAAVLSLSPSSRSPAGESTEEEFALMPTRAFDARLTAAPLDRYRRREIMRAGGEAGIGQTERVSLRVLAGLERRG